MATTRTAGSTAPELTLPSLDGETLSLTDLRGKRLLLFFWGSWWGCREQLPGWQRFAAEEAGDGNQVIAIALEHNGAERARPFVEDAGVTFPVLVDEEGVSSARFGFKAVPNGVLIDADGTIRWAKYGGFSIDNADDVDTVRRFFAGEEVEPYTSPDAPYSLGSTEQELVATKLRLGQVLAELGRGKAAVAAWRDALRLDPENLVIRKQIWATEHPERFHPTIDWDWQKAQLTAEREQEIADGICGPDGCPVPWATPADGVS